MNERFVKEFMALSPLYDPSDPEKANKPSEWEERSDSKKEDKAQMIIHQLVEKIKIWLKEVNNHIFKQTTMAIIILVIFGKTVNFQRFATLEPAIRFHFPKWQSESNNTSKY